MKPPNDPYQLQPGGYGLGAVRTRLLITGRGTPGPLTFGGREATVKCCGVTVAMPRGYSRVPTSSIDQSVNTGTFLALPEAMLPAWLLRLGSSSADRARKGRSRRSTPRPGKPAAWGRAAARLRGRCCNARRHRGGYRCRVAISR
jgi:hypothetical protein